MRTVISHLIVPLLMGLIMTVAYLGGFHKPEPKGVPVAIVGSVQTAGPIAAQVQSASHGVLRVSTVPDAATASAELKKLHLAGAFVPSPSKPTLIKASAAAPSEDSVVTKVFTNVAARSDRPLTVQDVVPLPESDPIGQNAFFYLVTLSVASYATAIGIGAAGNTRRFRERLGLLGAAALTISTVEFFFARVCFDMFGGHGWAVWGLSLAYSLIVMGIGVGLHALVGRLTTLILSSMFVALNFTSSGGVLAPRLQSGFFDWLHDFWIGSGFVQAAQHILYFPDSAIGSSVWILVGWAIFAVLCLLVAKLVERRRAQAQLAEARQSTQHRHHDGLTDDEETALELEEDVAV